MRHLTSLVLVVLLAGCPADPKPDPGPPPRTGQEDPPSPFGRFEGQVVAAWDDDGRNMTLREDFAYIDAQETRWHAPSGSVVNGASIPRPFWSLIGGPFEGKYRNASVIHDVACEQMTASWEDVHKMFHDACRCGDVSPAMSATMYWAVYNFGPRWNFVSETRTRTLPDGTTEAIEVRHPVPMAFAVHIDEELPGKVSDYFADHQDLSLEEIQSLSVEQVMQSE